LSDVGFDITGPDGFSGVLPSGAYDVSPSSQLHYGNYQFNGIVSSKYKPLSERCPLLAARIYPDPLSIQENGPDGVIVVPVEPKDACTFTASPSAIIYGQSSTLSWSCTPEGTPRTCEIKDGSGNTLFTGSQSGSFKVKPRRTTTYTLSCSGAPAVDNANVTVEVGFLPVLREILPR
jgi:hypothetical protein